MGLKKAEELLELKKNIGRSLQIDSFNKFKSKNFTKNLSKQRKWRKSLESKNAGENWKFWENGGEMEAKLMENEVEIEEL